MKTILKTSILFTLEKDFEDFFLCFAKEKRPTKIFLKKKKKEM